MIIARRWIYTGILLLPPSVAISWRPRAYNAPFDVNRPLSSCRLLQKLTAALAKQLQNENCLLVPWIRGKFACACARVNRPLSSNHLPQKLLQNNYKTQTVYLWRGVASVFEHALARFAANLKSLTVTRSPSRPPVAFLALCVRTRVQDICVKQTIDWLSSGVVYLGAHNAIVHAIAWPSFKIVRLPGQRRRQAGRQAVVCQW